MSLHDHTPSYLRRRTPQLDQASNVDQTSKSDQSSNVDQASKSDQASKTQKKRIIKISTIEVNGKIYTFPEYRQYIAIRGFFIFLGMLSTPLLYFPIKYFIDFIYNLF